MTMVEAKALAEALAKAWDPDKHPRVPAGHGRLSGQFMDVLDLVPDDGDPLDNERVNWDEAQYPPLRGIVGPFSREKAQQTLAGRLYGDRETISHLLDEHDVYLVDGLLCIIERPDAQHRDEPERRRVDPEMAQHFLQQVHRMQSANPIRDDFIIHLTEAPFRGPYGNDLGVGGFTNGESLVLCVRPRVANADPMQWKMTKQYAQDGWLMPVGGRVRPIDYLLAHEWGHAVMDSRLRERVLRYMEDVYRRRMVAGYDPLEGLSEYGRSDAAESYAEAFAQWVLSGRIEPPDSELASKLVEHEEWVAATPDRSAARLLSLSQQRQSHQGWM